MITHVIYHIAGRKVGCTKDFDRRKQRYLESEGSIPEIEVLEELHDKTDREAGDIEWQWADKFGYKRGVHYSITIRMLFEGSRRAHENRMPEQKIEFGKKAARKTHGNRTPEQRSEFVRKASNSRTSDQRVEHARKAGLIGGRRTSELGLTGFQRRGMCLYCDFEGNLAILGRHHGNNCKNRPMQRGS